ncbi:MarR family transcriptional regulator [Pseudonocardiaceae bacterium YIM PH 21723]|nr:MarR family transcriptional regulator [Pseudonocardiaceae bacterium YIM PH 21723]
MVCMCLLSTYVDELATGYRRPMTDRHDLGAAFGRLTRAMVEAEEPILRRHDLEMWDYVLLSALESAAAPTQAELAATVRRDKTRIIPLLDSLEERRLLSRTPDPADRRNRIVALTDTGRAVLRDARAEIRRMEAGYLASIPAGERKVFLDVLDRLAAAAG